MLGIFGGAKNLWNGVFKPAAKTVGSKVKSGVSTVWDKAKDLASDFGNSLANTWDKVLNGNTNETNRRIAEETNASNEKIARENLEYQKEVQEYNKALQEKIFQREDTAYTRTAADMKAAGLNPLTMNGTNGAGEAIAMNPLNNDYQAQGYDYNSMSPLEAMQMILGFGSAVESIRSQKLQNESLSLSNRFNRDTYNDRVTAQSYETMMKQTENLLKSYDEANAYQKRIYNSMFGINDSMSPDERQAAIINTVIGDDDELREALQLSGDKSQNKKLKRYGKTYSGIQGGKAVKSILESILP